MSDLLLAQKRCELHVHLGGCLFAEDLLELARDHYRQVDWTLYQRAYEKAFGLCPDPVELFAQALAERAGALDRLREHYVFRQEDGGDFARFQAKFNLAICLYRHWWQVLDREQEIVRRIVDRHRSEGLSRVEYRAMAPYGPESAEAFLEFHRLNARVLRQESGAGFQARYLISLPRWAVLESYLLVRRLLQEEPGLAETIVGLDFCHFEEGYAPAGARPFFEHLHRDNEERPEEALQVAYHVGEVYFDKSLESAVRWCHEAALLGARRLGHCIALGLDPGVALLRQPEAHEREKVAERLAQIGYDLTHARELEARGVEIDAPALEEERRRLSHRPGDEKVHRPYDEKRLEQVRRRQDYVLSRLAQLGACIETCPTSNLRIGAVPGVEHHPLHRFLGARVDLVIGADDPGIFDITLESEIEWARLHSGLDARALATRLGDPQRLGFAR